MNLPPVSVVCPNLSSNSLGRSLLLAELLATETDVEIVGAQLEGEVWRPATASSIPIRAYPLRAGRRHYFDAVPWLRQVTEGRFALVSKPVLQSLGLSILAGAGRQRGLLVDIDDWQTGFFQSRSGEVLAPLAARLARLKSYARRGGVNGFVLTRALEAYAKRQPHIVSNRWLQQRFGGEVVYHVRDPNVLDPNAAYGPPPAALDPARVWVGFVGTPRLHKGIDVLLNAVVIANQATPVGLAVMGCQDSEPFVAEAQRRLGEGFVSLPPFPWSRLAEHVRLPDILAIPSLNVPAAWGQIPAKLFDALSMAKPVVASAVNDLPEILADCGRTVPGGDATAFAGAIVELARDAELRQQLGARGRAKLIERFSYAAGREVLVRAVKAAAR